jgi:K+-sensing histidine kinase KdpD
MKLRERDKRAKRGDWMPVLPGVERQIVLLRWLALLLALILHLFDRATSGVLFPTLHMALGLVAYNALLLLLMRYIGWLRHPLNYLAVDTVLATLAVFLTGGYHSSFFVLYVFIAIGAAFYLDLVRTAVATLSVGLIYVAACYVNPAGLESPYAQYILAAKLLLLLVVAVLCSFLLEQLRQEHQQTEREQALSRHLRALNDLFRQLNTTLDLDTTLQMVAEAPRTLLGADLTTISLVDKDGKSLAIAATSGLDMSMLNHQPRPLTAAPISNALCCEQPCVLDDPAQCAIGQQVTRTVASVTCVPLLSDHEPLGMLAVAYSTPHRFAEEELTFLQALGQEAALAIRNARLYEHEREQVARLRALEGLQASFASSVSHELRTPLTCIKASIELLGATADSLSEVQANLVHTIGQDVSRLEALVTDLLEITRLEAGQVALSLQPADLVRIVERVVAALRPLIDRKGQTVRLHLPDSPGLVEADRRRIEQALTNILSNAVKFTPKQGQIDICVTQVPGRFQVCVADDGPGIPDQEQAHVFDKFYVVADGQGLSGVGLGLYIARQMIELHGGRIWVESRLAEGSTFCFEIPTGPRGERP